MPEDPFARPLLQLGTPKLGELNVAAAPSAGQGLSLDEKGIVPQSALPYIVTGRVSAAGGVNAGSGYSVSKVATGQYRVVFTKPFGSVPLVLAMMESVTINGFVEIAPGLLTVNGFDAFTISVASHTVADEAFQFLAISII